MKTRGVQLGLAVGMLVTLFAIVPADGENALPATPLPLFEGGTLDLRSLTGNVVVIRFVASW